MLTHIFSNGLKPPAREKKTNFWMGVCQEAMGTFQLCVSLQAPTTFWHGGIRSPRWTILSSRQRGESNLESNFCKAGPKKTIISRGP